MGEIKNCRQIGGLVVGEVGTADRQPKILVGPSKKICSHLAGSGLKAPDV